ncbi:MAG: hypothetical protein JWP88_1816 [Flaviaesturariibacter sp.]|nr:hypothetical protein [Flaviaesturariibacter sp.]
MYIYYILLAQTAALMRQFAILFLFLQLVLPQVAKAQYRFTPFKDNPARVSSLLEAIDKRCEADRKSLSGEYKKYTADVYKERCDIIKKYVTEKEVLIANETQSYLETLVAEIIKTNPTLQGQQLRILFSRSHYANAASLGDGTILFNIGLFHRLENEAQVIFALCHEIAHFMLNHGNNHIEQYIHAIYSSDFQKKLKTIQKSEYGQNKQLENLAQKFTFSTRRHSREHETAADSMALELMRNTHFDVRESLSLLAMFDSTDKDKFNVPLELEKRFHFSNYPFKKRWLESDDLIFTNDKEKSTDLNADSLRTHPDCQKRIAILSPKVKDYYKTDSRKFLTSDKTFEELKKQFDYEIVEYCYQSGAESRAMYFALQMLTHYPNDVYLNTLVGRCLNDFYTHQKAHELDKIVDRPNAGSKDQYNLLLQFIQNLSLIDIAALSQNFLSRQEPVLSADPDFQKVYRTSKDLSSPF